MFLVNKKANSNCANCKLHYVPKSRKLFQHKSRLTQSTEHKSTLSQDATPVVARSTN